VPPKKYLFTPGPTPVPPQVLAAMAEPVVHHRSPDFKPIYERCLTRLREVCRTERDVLLYAASGTGAFESAVANLVSPGEPHLVVSAGNFGERWAAMTAVYGAEVDHLRYAWGETPDADDVRARLRERPAKALWVVQSETSTGVVADVQALAVAAKEAGALSVVDAISSLGAVPCETDAWGLDVVVSGTQKGMSTPPGLSFASVSPAAWERSRETSTPRFYFDWKRTLDAQNGGGSPFTPATATVNALNVALDRVLDEGLEAIWQRTRALAGRFRARVLASGLELYSPDDESCSLVTAVQVPEGADAGELRRAVLAAGYIIEGGRGRTAGKVLRFGHLGATDEDALNAGFDALLAALPK
jgi:aspartate aminotransferase-like enzyme